MQTRNVVTATAPNPDSNQPEDHTQYITSPQQAAHSSRSYYTSGDKLEPTLVTELIGTNSFDYLRIRDAKSLTPGKPQPDISKVKDVWADTNGASEKIFSVTSQIFSVTSQRLLLAPIGYLNPTDRRALLTQMQNDHVYGKNFLSVKRVSYHGRPTYVYEINVQTYPYVKALKTFADKTNLTDLSAQLNPEEYKEAAPFNIQISVDIINQQIVEIHQSSTDMLTALSSYNMKTPEITRPKNAITLTELQSRLQALR
jgi:hypothetical protein